MRADALALCLLFAVPASAGDLSGRVRFAYPEVAVADLQPIVAFLTPESSEPEQPAPRPAPVLRQRNARFDPTFLVTVSGEGVAMPNDDVVVHNVYSLSDPNDFDLGIHSAGERRSVAFAHPGVVRIFCSIHESMQATILVVPTPWFATAGWSGRYRIPDVPPGRYRLTVWSEKVAPASRMVSVGADGSQVDVTLGATADSGAPTP